MRNNIRMRRIGALLVAVMLFGVTSCIKNDLPYPRIQPNFTAFEVEGQLRAAAIDSASRSVTVYLDESTDIKIGRAHV